MVVGRVRHAFTASGVPPGGSLCFLRRSPGQGSHAKVPESHHPRHVHLHRASFPLHAHHGIECALLWCPHCVHRPSSMAWRTRRGLAHQWRTGKLGPLLIQAVLESSKYVDEEVEGLLRVDGGDPDEVDRLLSPPPQLSETWSSQVELPSLSTGKGEHTPVGALGTSGEATAPPPGCEELGIATPAADAQQARASATVEPDTREESVWPRGAERRGDVDFRCASGPDLADNHADQSSLSRGVLPRVDDASDSREVQGGAAGAALGTARGQGGCRRTAYDDLARDWGLEDPRLLRTMKRRMRRMRGFERTQVKVGTRRRRTLLGRCDNDTSENRAAQIEPTIPPGRERQRR